LFDIDIYATGLAVSLGLGIGGWLFGLLRRATGIADLLWPLSFLAMSVTYALSLPMAGDRAYVVFFLVGVWASRLASFLVRRGARRRERRRRPALPPPGSALPRESLYLVFGLRAILAWMMSLSVYMALAGAAALGPLDYIAATLWLFGFFFEVVGDEQLDTFRQNPQNEARVLEGGLWRLTRHPNYFGELCIWWGFWLFSAAAGAWWTLPAPVLATYLLVSLARAPLSEREIAERPPGYGDYARRTSMLIPRPPRRR
jgi:steroid 5-alpha reductase family enzyme